VAALTTTLAIVEHRELSDEQEALAQSRSALNVVNHLKEAGDMPMYVNDYAVPDDPREGSQP
jgi:hypothetical protein